MEDEYLDNQGLETLVDEIRSNFLSVDGNFGLTSDEIDNIITTAANEAYSEVYGE